MVEAIRLHRGDCVEVMATLPENHFDAIVTDPPYHLTTGKNGKTGFMGETWDGGDVAFRAETWAAALRVLKPGGHLVAFNASRTFHQMACAIEAAGFEVRDAIVNLYDTGDAWAAFVESLTPDQADALGRALAGADGSLLAWLYGTGFPKSLNVAASIDKLRHDTADVLRVTQWVRETRDARGVKNRDIDAAFGTNGMAGHWTSAASQPAIPTLEQIPLLLSVLGVAEADVPPEIRRLLIDLNGRKGEFGEGWKAREITGKVEEWTDRANYAITSADGLRRDKAATDAAKAWEGWGTALKPAIEPICLARKPLAAGSVGRQHLATGTGGLNIDAARTDGRWPANVVTDGSPAVLGRFPMDQGGTVARFFYSAKADDDDRQGSKHPTVKPQSLMRWLVRLVTAKDGLVLDPFAGSGSTGWAAWREGRRAELIEMTPEHADHIAARIKTLTAPAPVAVAADAPQGDLFA